MADIEYRLFFNNTQAGREDLDRIETVTVEQEMGLAWEAELEIPIRLDKSGQWVGEEKNFMESFSRVRVDVRNGETPYTPLIDGPVIGFKNAKNPQPGQSTVFLVVGDDSIFLDRDTKVECFENLRDHQVVERLFDEVPEIAATDIEAVPDSGSELPTAFVRRGTIMATLIRLAKSYGKQAFVLPGSSPGRSIGCFKTPPIEGLDLPDLVLTGPARNIESLSVNQDAQTPTHFKTSRLSLTDKRVEEGEFLVTDLDLLGDLLAVQDQTRIATTLMSPSILLPSADTTEALAGLTREASYSQQATGELFGHCYPGILQPYRAVVVRSGGSRLSGKYLITQVTHQLTRSFYKQSFEMKGNGLSIPETAAKQPRETIS